MAEAYVAMEGGSARLAAQRGRLASEAARPVGCQGRRASEAARPVGARAGGPLGRLAGFLLDLGQ